MKIVHVPCYSTADPIPVLEENMEVLESYAFIGIVGTAQHLNMLDQLKACLEARGKKASVGGQILGCRQENALKLDVDCFIYVGSGRFHPLGIALKTEKPVFILNPISGVLDRITDAEKRRWIGKRKGAIARALESKTFGIMVSTKDGQFDLKRAFVLKRRLEAKGKKACIFAAEELSPNNLIPFKVDCWVNTACPRIEGDEYNRPVVNAAELEALLACL
ncbi:MAG: diphthamide synthesis protein [Candidatus Altiarchaeota archaeon]